MHNRLKGEDIEAHGLMQKANSIYAGKQETCDCGASLL
jgi:hypothetical protein